MAASLVPAMEAALATVDEWRFDAFKLAEVTQVCARACVKGCAWVCVPGCVILCVFLVRLHVCVRVCRL